MRAVMQRDGRAVGDVAALDLAPDLGCEAPEHVVAPRDENTVPALPCEQPRGRLADPGGGSGDDGDPAAYGRTRHPSPGEGSAAFAWNARLVRTTRAPSRDTSTGAIPYSTMAGR